MAMSDSLALSSPFVPAKRPDQAERRRAEVLARGNALVACPQCQAPDAEKEPPVSVVRCGEHYLQGVTRCLKCGPQLETVKAPLFEPFPHTREETVPMPEEAPTSTPPVDFTCACGCGVAVKPGRKFATNGCGLRFNHANGIRGGRKPGSPAEKASTPAGEPGPNQLSPLVEIVSREHARLYLLSLTSEQRAAYLEMMEAEARFLKLGGR